MILIFSVVGDFTTTKVCKWLNAWSVEFLRINGDIHDYKFVRYNSQTNDIIFSYNDSIINLKDVKAVWYRKSGLTFRHFDTNYFPKDEDFFFEEGTVLKRIVQKENSTLIDYIHWNIEQKPNLGKKYNADLNKLRTITLAQSVGLGTPETYVLTSKKQLSKLLDEKGKLITKAIKDGLYQFNKEHAYYTYTEKVDKTSLDLYPEHFSPTLFQTMVEKAYELRIFYFDNTFYSMAVFSQEDEKTEVDYRKSSEFSRRIPYKLPKAIQNKLKQLMTLLDLNTGSADIIVDTDGNYHFLEINPVGQFSMVSNPCNFHLEQKVAKHLWSLTKMNTK